MHDQVEEEQSQQRELALEKENMASAFSNLKKLVEEDADAEAEYVKVWYDWTSIIVINTYLFYRTNTTVFRRLPTVYDAVHSMWNMLNTWIKHKQTNMTMCANVSTQASIF